MRLPKMIYGWFDERYRITPLIEEEVTHKQVPRTLGWAACFGGLSLLLFMVQVFTGILLVMYYHDEPASAWDSVTFIKSNVHMGWLIQRIHTVGANLMVVMVMMHMARVAYYKIFRKPRELHWISGVFLALLTTVMAFTGYLLPWTQLSYWGAKVGTEIPSAVPIVGNQMVEFIRRGKNINAETLSFFFSLHIWVIPVVIISFMGMHFAMIKRTGISRPL